MRLFGKKRNGERGTGNRDRGFFISRWIRARFDAAQTTKDNARHWAAAEFLSADAEADPAVRKTLRTRAQAKPSLGTFVILPPRISTAQCRCSTSRAGKTSPDLYQEPAYCANRAFARLVIPGLPLHAFLDRSKAHLRMFDENAHRIPRRVRINRKK